MDELETLLEEIASRRDGRKVPTQKKNNLSILLDKLMQLMFPPESTSFKDGPTPTRKPPIGPNRLSPMPSYPGSPEVPPQRMDKKKLIELIAGLNQGGGQV